MVCLLLTVVALVAFGLVARNGWSLLNGAGPLSGPSRSKQPHAVLFTMGCDRDEDADGCCAPRYDNPVHWVAVDPVEFVAVSEFVLDGIEYVKSMCPTGTEIPWIDGASIGEWEFSSYDQLFPDPRLSDFHGTVFAEAPYVDSETGEPLSPPHRAVVKVEVSEVSRNDWNTRRKQLERHQASKVDA